LRAQSTRRRREETRSDSRSNKGTTIHFHFC
jgi:hypothetical protein